MSPLTHSLFSPLCSEQSQAFLTRGKHRAKGLSKKKKTMTIKNNLSSKNLVKFPTALPLYHAARGRKGAGGWKGRSGPLLLFRGGEDGGGGGGAFLTSVVSASLIIKIPPPLLGLQGFFLST